MIYLYIYIFIIGSVLASFVQASVSRLLRGESIIRPRSHCTNCNHQLRWYELIPIFSYIFLKGKCSSCKKNIGAEIIIAEIGVGLLFLITFLIYGFTCESLIGFILILIAESIIITDFKEMIILDSTLAFGIVSILLIEFLKGGVHQIYKIFFSAIFSFTLFYLIKIIGDKLYNRESLGGGDIKLAFLMGLECSPQLFLITLILSSFLATPYAFFISTFKKQKELSFGPFLVMSLYIVFMFKNQLIILLNFLRY